MKKDERETFKELSESIVNALIKDATVMAQLEDLRDRHVIEPGALLGMALKVTELLEISGITISEDEKNILPDIEKAQETKSDSPKQISSGETGETKETIDGRDLSTSEVEFQEWTSKQFDTKEWLKKTGLIW